MFCEGKIMAKRSVPPLPVGVLVLMIASAVTIRVRSADAAYLPFGVCPNAKDNGGDSNEPEDADTYRDNAESLLNSLAFNAFRFTGFADGTAGSEPNQVYGLAMCYGDTMPGECRHCVADAHIVSHCFNPIVFLERCMMRVSPANFLGVVDTLNVATRWAGDAVKGTVLFDQKVRMMVDNFTAEGSKIFAFGDVPFEGNLTIHGLAQCTRDISLDEYKNCLATLTSQLGRAGGRPDGFVATGSCVITYTVPQLQRSSAPPPIAGSGNLFRIALLTLIMMTSSIAVAAFQP